MPDVTTYPLQEGLGQTFTITAQDQGTLTNEGAAGAVTILNNFDLVTCGLALPPPGGIVPTPQGGTAPVPICSVQLLQGQGEVLTPQPGIILMLDNTVPSMLPGTVVGVQQMNMPAVMVSLTPASPSATVTLNDAGEWVGGTPYPPAGEVPGG